MPFEVTCPPAEPIMDPNADHAAVVASAIATNGVMCVAGSYDARFLANVEPHDVLAVVIKIRLQVLATHAGPIPLSPPAGAAETTPAAGRPWTIRNVPVPIPAGTSPTDVFPLLVIGWEIRIQAGVEQVLSLQSLFCFGQLANAVDCCGTGSGSSRIPDAQQQQLMAAGTFPPAGLPQTLHATLAGCKGIEGTYPLTWDGAIWYGRYTVGGQNLMFQIKYGAPDGTRLLLLGSCGTDYFTAGSGGSRQQAPNSYRRSPLSAVYNVSFAAAGTCCPGAAAVVTVTE